MISTLCINANHKTKCEDTVWVSKSDELIVGGVFDGTGSGVNSHWASQTLAYVFDAKANFPTVILSDHGINDIRHTLKAMAEILDLPRSCFLSTAFIFKYEITAKKLSIRCLGDGSYFINNIEYKIDRGASYECIGDYIYAEPAEFKAFLERYPIIRYEGVNSFQICSDGIDRIEQSQFIDCPTDPLSLLLANPGSPNYLERMWNILKRQKFTLGDDLSIISYSTDATTT